MREMRTIILILTTFLTLTQGCYNKLEKKNSNSIETPQVIKKEDNSKKLPPEYLDVLSRAIEQFPNDSVSLYRFYSRIYDKKKVESQIQRIENLLADEFIHNYNLVNKHLRLILENTVSNNLMTCDQADSIAQLYSFYDNCQGGSMCSQVLTGNDNYDLVWKSFKIMSKESKKDTCFISALIYLDDHIRTNVELAEVMPKFIVESIKNNTEGFLDMYFRRNSETQNSYWRYVSYYDQPDSTLMSTLNDISTYSNNETHRTAATEILQNIDNQYN